MKLILALTMLLAMVGSYASASEIHGHKVNEYIWDFDVDGGSDLAAISLSAKSGARALPLHAVITGVSCWVETAAVGANSVYSLGNTASSTAYLSSVAVATLVKDYVVSPAVVPYAVSAANKEDILLTIGTQVATAGKLHCWMHYDY